MAITPGINKHVNRQLLHRVVDAVERKIGQTGGVLTLKCKDLRTIQLEIPGLEACCNVANSLEQLSSLENPRMYYPFFHQAMFDIFENGWAMFSPETEFSTMLINNDDWRLSYVNKDYDVCPSYSQALIVPKSIDDNTVIASANFRYLGRFPVLSFLHKENKAALLRSSQPMVGTNSRRSKEDERLVNAVLGPSKKGYIIDTRTQNLAQLARTKGGGVEPEMHYPLWRRVHKPIDRHSTLLDSLTKLVEACSETNCTLDKWISRLESSSWLANIKDVLGCACVVAQCIDQEGSSVLVHGAEGTDATLQICSLAQVILDPDCRTVHGFEALIEREWLRAGHPFALRHHHGAFSSSSSRTKDQSATFLMFLDCVQQIHYQFPCSFEFNEQFLILLFDHSYASQFGTFLTNCEKDSKDLKLSDCTVSLWSHINRPDVLNTYLNPMYEPNNKVIWPSVAPQSLVLWSGLYLRWVVDLENQWEAWKTIALIREQDKSLRSKAVKLRRQLLDLEREAIERGLFQHNKDDIFADTGVS